MPIIGEINQKKECTIEWLIKDFFSLSTEDGEMCLSPVFVFANISWFIQMLPNGSKAGNSKGYISLYLHRESPGLPISVEYTLGVKTVGDKLDPKLQAKSIFKGKSAYGYHNFLNRGDVLKIKYRITSSDMLTFVCNIKFSETFSKEISTFRKNKVLQDYKELFLKKNDCDVIIKVKGQEFPAHKVILSARSPVFESTFRPKRKKRKTGILNINDFEPPVFSDFLCFLYCGDVEIITMENVFSLLAAADKYNVCDLTDMCLEFMKENLSIDTFCDTITWALEHSETDLITSATDFFTANGHKIVKTSKWESFLAINPTKGNELVIKAFQSLQDMKK